MIIISKDFSFEASHVLPRHPGKCSRLHGHSWKLRVSIIGEIDPSTGFVCDYGDLSRLVTNTIISRLDHVHLGQGIARTYGTDSLSEFYPALGGKDFYPSSENLVTAIATILQPDVKGLPNGPTLYEIRLAETCTSEAIWRADLATPTGSTTRSHGNHRSIYQQCPTTSGRADFADPGPSRQVQPPREPQPGFVGPREEHQSPGHCGWTERRD